MIEAEIVAASNDEDTTDELKKEEAIIVNDVVNSSEDSSKKVGDIQSDDESFSLDELSELFDEYVGVSISGFISYKSSVPDLEQKIGPKKGILNILSGVEKDGKSIWLRLNTYSGKHGGYLKISPSLSGQFSERSAAEDPDKMAKYRIKFAGEDCIEYSDQDDKGEISYFAGYR